MVVATQGQYPETASSSVRTPEHSIHSAALLSHFRSRSTTAPGDSSSSVRTPDSPFIHSFRPVEHFRSRSTTPTPATDGQLIPRLLKLQFFQQLDRGYEGRKEAKRRRRVGIIIANAMAWMDASMFVLIVELLHPWRRYSRDPSIAADYLLFPIP